MNKIENQVFLSIITNRYFNNEINFVKNKISMELGIPVKQIEKAIKNLQNAHKIRISGKIILDEKSIQKNDLLKENDLETKTATVSENDLVLGTIKKSEKGFYIFAPYDKNLPYGSIMQSDYLEDAVGKNCCVKVLKQTDKSMQCQLEKIFGIADDPIERNIAIAYKYGFVKEFPENVINEVKKIPQSVTTDDMLSRKDMRNIPFLPIDPATCKDKDDAIYAEKTNDGFRCYIAIADVSHYVKNKTRINIEAFKRGTSCYLGSGVYPMIPPELSNGICSLNDGVDRLALVCTVDIDNKGEIKNYKFEKAVIKVKKSLSYDVAEKIHLCQDNFDKKYADIKQNLDILYDATDILEKKLEKRGMVKFLNEEPMFKFNADKNVIEDIDISNKERSHIVVEQFMILANEATAQFFKDNSINGVYRVHQNVTTQKMTELQTLLAKYNISYPLQNDPKSFQGLLEKISNHPALDYLNDAIICKFSKAKYQATNEGHFGLASQGYTHFTSPIRRYADLLAHRMISEYLDCKKVNESRSFVDTICEHINDQEVSSIMAERESDKYLCAKWAERHIGDTYDCFISKIDNFGIEVKKSPVRFTLPLSELQDGKTSPYRIIKNGMAVTNGKCNYELGDKIKVVIKKSDLENSEITVTEANEHIMQNNELEKNI